MTFRSRIDAVLAVVLCAGAVVPVATLVYLGMHGRLDVIRLIALGPMSAAVSTVAVWTLLSTFYVVDSESLFVRSGPFRWNIPYSSIKSVRPSRNPLSGPALSFDRLEITYDGYSVLYISPKPREAFLTALRAHAPQASFGDHRKRA
jgi:hypothetical protein